MLSPRNVFRYSSLDFGLMRPLQEKAQSAFFQRWIIYKPKARVNDYLTQLSKTEREGPIPAHPVRLAGWGEKPIRPFPAVAQFTVRVVFPLTPGN
jgi:hypothetical protein